MDLSNKEFIQQSFIDQDLSKSNLSYSKFICCNFDRANLEKANATHSIFSGSSFNDSNLRYTDFGHSDLQDTAFYPRDAYGVTFTLECRTFKGMKISRLWWWCYRFFSLMMIPELENGKDPRDIDILALGERRYLKLSRMFQRRGM